MGRAFTMMGMVISIGMGQPLPGQQQIHVLSKSLISSSSMEAHDWYGIDVDPKDSNRLIACGMKWNEADNAYYGFVYDSADNGRTWRAALEDKSTKWVSEESCAFGVDGTAYFVADASEIDESGQLHHDHGVSRIWVSRDFGEHWTLGITTGWTDFSASAVDRTPGPAQNRLYIFFNNVWSYFTSIHGAGEPNSVVSWTTKVGPYDQAGNTTGLLSYRVGDAHMDGPQFAPDMYKMRLRGAYPGQLIVLRDHSLLALVWSKQRVFDANGKRTGTDFLLTAQHTDLDRKVVSEPVVIQQSMDHIESGRSTHCNSFLLTPAAYDPVKNTVYSAYTEEVGGKCELMLAKSSDDGRTWSRSAWVGKDDRSHSGVDHDFNSLALARRDDGVLGLIWSDSGEPDSWLFAVSEDDGSTYSSPIRLASNLPTEGFDPGALGFWANQEQSEGPTDGAALIRIDSHIGPGTPHTTGVVVGPDGVFHAIWSDHSRRLYSAAIAVTAQGDRNVVLAGDRNGWRYQTRNVGFTYGGSQQFDSKTGVITDTVVIRNLGADLLKGPIRLEISPESRMGLIYSLDAMTEGSGNHVAEYLDISKYIPESGLEPGGLSSPIPLRFRFEPNADAIKQASLAGGSLAYISVRLLTKEAK